MGRGKSIRTYLVGIVLAAVLPMIAFASVLVAELGRKSLDQISASVGETARALASAVERHFVSSVRPLEILAASAALEEEDFPRFQAEARRALATQPSWRNIVLATRDGQVVLEALDTAGGSPRPILEHESLARVVDTQSPSVGPLVTRSYGDGPTFAVRVPVRSHGRLRWLLSAIVSPAAIHDTLVQQNLQGAWIAKVFDQRETIVASTHDPSRMGTRVAPMLRSKHDAEGWVKGIDSRGLMTYAAYAHASSGWGVAITLPVAAFEEPSRRFILLVMAGGGALLALALLAATAVGRRIAAPLRQLSELAAMVGAGKVPQQPSARITEVHQVALALVSAAAERQAAETELRHAIRQREEILAAVSHDLRSPLSTIRLSAGRLARADVPAAMLASVRATIERAVLHMDRLIRDLLDLAAIDTGALRITTETCDVGAMLADALDMLEPQACKKALKIERDIGARLSARCDRERLAQVLSNLVGNAIKFTPEHGTIAVVASASDDEVIISVRDTGPGIPSDDLPHLFERYWQGGKRKTPGGVGLGLAIAKAIVHAHGGRIWAESDSTGATLAFTLPRA